MHMVEDLVRMRDLIRTAQSQHHRAAKRPIIIDVGANIGVFSLYMARHGYKVAAYEPVRENFRRLAFAACVNLALYGGGKKENSHDDADLPAFPELVLANRVVSNRTDVPYQMLSNQTNMGHSGVATGKRAAYDMAHMTVGADFVKSTTLDSEFAEPSAAGRRADLLKIDVEGFEGFVLDGARRLLSTCRPHFIFIELNPSYIDAHEDGPMRFVDILLKSKDYVLLSTIQQRPVDFWQTEEGIRQFAASLDPVNDWGDYTFQWLGAGSVKDGPPSRVVGRRHF